MSVNAVVVLVLAKHGILDQAQARLAGSARPSHSLSQPSIVRHLEAPKHVCFCLTKVKGVGL